MSSPAVCDAGLDLEEEPEHWRKIRRVRVQLVDLVRRTNQMMAAMLEAGHVSAREVEMHGCQEGLFDSAEHMVDVLLRGGRGSEAVYECWLGALRQTGQEHLIRLLEEPGLSPVLLPSIH